MSENRPYIWNYANSYEFREKVREGMPPLIICVACNGGVQGMEYNENLPETADEIADSVYSDYKAEDFAWQVGLQALALNGRGRFEKEIDQISVTDLVRLRHLSR